MVPVKNIEGVATRHSDVDMVIIRENTEGEYSGLEHEVTTGVVQSLKVVSTHASRNIAKYAFEYAVANNRRSVTAVHKANIMKKADGATARRESRRPAPVTDAAPPQGCSSTRVARWRAFTRARSSSAT